MNSTILRNQLGALLAWADAHVDLDGAVADVPESSRGAKVEGYPHSLWELLEHIRLAQEDILDFCRNADYRKLDWPADYWPPDSAPPTAAAWEESVGAIRRDRAMLQAMAADPDLDLTATIPHGTGQTYLREILLVADHTAYHVGQIVVLRRLLGIWRGS